MLPRHAISDDDWARVRSLLPTRGPAGDRRRFVDAVLYVARTGIPWRDLPERFGPWNSAWRRFDRWSRAGVWQRVFEALQDPDMEWLILDSTVIRAHPSAAGASKKLGRQSLLDQRRPIGLSSGEGRPGATHGPTGRPTQADPRD
jgi:transposase